MRTNLLRKGQLQIGESMMVIIILLIVGVFIFVFAANNMKEKYEIKLAEHEELDTLETAKIVTKLYELSCAKEGVATTCVDLHKAQALSNVIQNNNEAYLYYYNLFFNTKITIYELYPHKKNYTIYEVNATNTTLYQQESKALIIPVSLHNASADTISFGMLSIERFHKGSGAS